VLQLLLRNLKEREAPLALIATLSTSPITVGQREDRGHEKSRNDQQEKSRKDRTPTTIGDGKKRFR
jgi:hypothetical protein